MVTTMISALQELANLLSSDPVVVDDVVAHLGTVTETYSGNVVLMPEDPVFTSGNIVHKVGGTIPAHVVLTLAETISLKILAETFGSYKIPPQDRGVPPKALFSLDMPKKPYRIKLIATLTGRGDDSDVTAVTLRRDMRL